ncbi:hypothetical protein HY041_00195 [Candidatus Roizmanbacteria bacterium]|nr:hypothetical protein [Candidatus Roizmanbacteria bacterium]
MKKILVLITLIFFFSLYIKTVHAGKILPQSKVSKKTNIKQSSATGISVTPKLRRDRKALLVYFNNLQNAQSVSYMLIYKTNGQEEGAGGSVNPSQGNTASRELLFGTCSKNVCRYHSNITNMKLEVTAELKSGKKLIKRYKIRI